MLLCASMVMLASAAAQGPAESLLRAGQSLFVDFVWSGAPVGFSMAVRNGRQYVAYYDSERRMTLACRSLDSEKWTYNRLDERIGWDSHNGVTFAFDSEGYIHLSGNMHGVPLRYFRSAKPWDIKTLERIDRMTGRNENRCTYPRFSTSPEGALLFSYRDGGSGNGSEVVNVYDVSAKTWRRYIETNLFDGQGQMSAYYTGPVRDSKGLYHFAWVWRDTPDCSTNHDVSYIRSSGLRNGFARSDGAPVELPITIAEGEVIDPVPAGGGLLNNVNIGLDSRDRVMITYHKFDEKGLTQVYTARREDSGWKIYRTTDWRDRWEFRGNGSIASMIAVGSPGLWRDGVLYQVFTNKYLAPYAQVRFLDEDTLIQIGEPVRLLPTDFAAPEAKYTDDWQVNTRGGGVSEAIRNGRSWALRWESAGANRDAPRETVPPSSKLRVVELVTNLRPWHVARRLDPQL